MTWVTQWLDFSFKYGMGFTMSNGVSGVFFNDNTKILSSGDNQTIKYVYRSLAKGTDGQTSIAKDVVVIYDIENHPADVQKKISLYQNFCKFFN